MATVAELLQNCCPELKVLNVNADLSRNVITADITETPDVAEYIGEGTLVITTGMAFQSHPESLISFIQTLDKKPVPAVAIKLGRFIDELPQSVLSAASLLQFPILLIPKDSTLGIVSHKILSYLWGSEAKTLALAMDVQRKFAQFVISDAPVESMVTKLGEMLDRSVLYISPFLGVESKSLRAPQDAPFLELTLSTLRRKYPGHEGHPQNKTHQLYGPDGENASVSIYPVKVDSCQIYWLAILNVAEIPYPFSELVLEQVTTSLAFAQYKKEILYQNTLDSKKNFFRLLQKAQQGPEVFQHLLNAQEYRHGIESSGWYQVVVAGIDSVPSHWDDQQVSRLVYRWLEHALSRKLEGAAVFPTKEQTLFAIVLQKPPTDLETVLAAVAEKLHSLFGLQLSYAVGNEVDRLDSIWFSHLKAYETYKQAVSKKESGFLHYYFSSGVGDLIQLIPASHAQHFAAYILKDLAYPKSGVNQELRKTLDALLDNQGDYSRAAESLYIHRNTVNYRIKKVEELLGVSLKNSKDVLNLRVALLITGETK